MIVTKSNISIEPSKNYSKETLNGWNSWRANALIKEGLIGLLDDDKIKAESFSNNSILSSSNLNVEWVNENLNFRNPMSKRLFQTAANENSQDSFRILRTLIPTLKSGRISVAKDVNVSAKKNGNNSQHDCVRSLNNFNKTQLSDLLVSLLYSTVRDLNYTHNDRNLHKELANVLSETQMNFYYPKYVEETNSWVTGSLISRTGIIFTALDSNFNKHQLDLNNHANYAVTDIAPINLDDIKELVSLSRNADLNDHKFFSNLVLFHAVKNQINASLANQIVWLNDLMNYFDTKADIQFVEKDNQKFIDIFKESNTYKKTKYNYDIFVSEIRDTYSVLLEDFMFYQNDRIYVRYSPEQAIKRQLINNELYDDIVGRHKLYKNYQWREERTRDHMFKKKNTINVIDTEMKELRPVQTNIVVFEDDIPVSLVPRKIDENIYSMFPKELISMFDSIPVVEGIPYDSSLRFDWGNKLEEPYYLDEAAQGIDMGATAGDMIFMDQSYVITSTLDEILKSATYNHNNNNYINYDAILNKKQQDLFTRKPLTEMVMEKLHFKDAPRKKKIIKALVCDETSSSTDWQVKEITLKDLTDNEIAFVPIMLPFQFDDLETFSKNQKQKQGYMIIFVSFRNILTLSKRLTLQNSIKEFIAAMSNKVTAKNYLLNREEWEKSKKLIKTNFELYNIKQYKIFKSKFGEKFLLRLNDRVQENALREQKVKEETLYTLFAKPKVEFEAKQKYDKMKSVVEAFNEKWNKSNSELETTRNTISSKVVELLNIRKDIDYHQKRMIELNNKLKTCQQESISKTSLLKNSATSIAGYINPKIKATEKMEEYNSEYQKEIKKAIETNNFELDPYLKNLAMNNIVINNLVVANKDGKQVIETLVFSILKPVQIKVDGNKNEIRYGGPYKIKLHKENVYISLLNTSGLMGIHPQGSTLYVHPHASPVNMDRDSLQSLYSEGARNCCLGEASPYIWKATQSKDLAMTILNLMIWVTSANSSDYWGRNYVYFPKSLEDNILDTSAEIANQIIETIREQEQAEEYDEDDNEEYDEEDEDFCDDHEFNDAGYCIHCGYYDEDYNLSAQEENQQPVTQVPAQYTPYVQTNNNNN